MKIRMKISQTSFDLSHVRFDIYSFTLDARMMRNREKEREFVSNWFPELIFNDEYVQYRQILSPCSMEYNGLTKKCEGKKMCFIEWKTSMNENESSTRIQLLRKKKKQQQQQHEQYCFAGNKK